MTLHEYYKKTVIPEMKKQFGYKADLAVPRITHVTVNVGLGKQGRGDSQFKEGIEKSLAIITGQKPTTTKARHSIAGFGIREGLIIGEKVTLRGKRMYNFLDKLINVVIPRTRDFRGLRKTSIDRCGNITIGFKENTVFPEINPEEISTVHGLEVTIATTAKDREEAQALFTFLKFPLKKDA